MSGRGKGKTAGKKAVSRSSKAGLQFPVGGHATVNHPCQQRGHGWPDC
jgi:hypothetical protein